MHFSFFLGLSPFWWEGDAAGQGWVKWTRAGYSRETVPSLPLRGDLGFFPGFTAANSLQVLALLKAELQMHFILWGPSQLIALSYSKCSLQLLQSCLSPLQVLFFWWKAGDNKKKRKFWPPIFTSSVDQTHVKQLSLRHYQYKLSQGGCFQKSTNCYQRTGGGNRGHKTWLPHLLLSQLSCS